MAITLKTSGGVIKLSELSGVPEEMIGETVNTSTPITQYIVSMGTNLTDFFEPGFSTIPSPYANPYSGSGRTYYRTISPCNYLRPPGIPADSIGKFPTISWRYDSSSSIKWHIIRITDDNTKSFLLSILLYNPIPPFYLATVKQSGKTSQIMGIVERGGEFYLQSASGNSGREDFVSDVESRKTATAILLAWDINTNPIPDTPTSPGWGNQDTNTTGGGNGDFDNTSTPLPLPSISSLGSASLLKSGFISAYCPDEAQMVALKDYLWSENVIQGITQMLPGQDPTNYIIGSHLIPATTEQIPHITDNFTFGVSHLLAGARPAVNLATQQIITIALGNIEVTEYSGTFFDYSPYAMYALYLPYIGMRNLSADIITNKTISIVYRIDIVTGSCTAYVMHEGNVLYNFSGNVASQFPLSVDNSGMFYNAVAAAIAGIAVAGFTAPMALGAVGAAGATAIPKVASTTAIRGATGVVSGAAKVGGALSKETSLSDANIGSGMGITNLQSAYLMRVLPNKSVPKDFQTIRGYVSNTSQKIGEFTGFTQFSDFHLEGLVQSSGQVGATRQEIDMISNALREGVIL